MASWMPPSAKAREYLEPLRQTGIDTLILGCTHYPLLMEVIGRVMGSGVTLINAGAEAARALQETLQSGDMLAAEQVGDATLYASDQPSDFGVMASRFLQEELKKPVLPVDIDRY